MYVILHIDICIPIYLANTKKKRYNKYIIKYVYFLILYMYMWLCVFQDSEVRE